jgi:hypothetical protein
LPVRYRRSKRTVWRHIHGSVLVRPTADVSVIALTGTGEDLWHLLSAPLTIEELAHCLGDRYARPAADIMRDIAPVLDELVTRGVLDEATQP